ncbi:MAG: squalene--hopene cyclase [Bacillus sp. (in: firmicutes)]
MIQQEVKESIDKRVSRLIQLQDDEGTWTFVFEGPIMTDCFTILLIKTLDIEDEELLEVLLKRIAGLQQEDGSWKLYDDEETGNLNATVQGYTAMLVSQKYKRSDERMEKAERFIEKNGGLGRVHFMTKVMLAVNGLYPYPPIFYFPMTYFLLPSSFPFSMYHCSNYARIHMTPMIISMNKKFKVEHNIDTDFYKGVTFDSWFRDERGPVVDLILDEIKKTALLPLHLHKAGYKEAMDLMLSRIEQNGTLYSYVSATFYMIYALMALGYNKKSRIIKKAFEGITSYIVEVEEGSHVQNSPSTVWDTALISYALQEAGVPVGNATIQKANHYLLKKQQIKRGDWAVNAPHASAGGWGFSDSNHFIPDNDDTSAALRALTGQTKIDAKVKRSWERGCEFLLAMQNRDGGFGAFEKNAYQKLLAHLPIENAKDALIDDSTADLTGRVLEFLGTFAGYDKQNRQVARALNWLLKHQNKDGSWYGKWGINYIYGTWAAVTGLRATGVEKSSEALQKAVSWLRLIQNEDGGWGESCQSPERQKFVPLGFSTPSQTAWALDALLTVEKPGEETIQKGIRFLLHQDCLPPRNLRYPTGLGLPGGFYIDYGSYNELFPLLALARYRKLTSAVGE